MVSFDRFKLLLEALELTQTHLEAKETFEEACRSAASGRLGLQEFLLLVKALEAKCGKLNLDAAIRLAELQEVGGGWCMGKVHVV